MSTTTRRSRTAGASRPGRGAPGDAPRSDTRRLLWTRLVLLLAGTVLVAVASLTTFGTAHRTAVDVRDRSSQSVIKLAAARGHLVEADAAAVQSFASGAATLAGPGARYQDLMALAGLELAQAAQANPSGSRALQVAQGLIVSYMGLLERAHAHHREECGGALATMYLSDASKLLHGDVLRRLDHERAIAARKLDEQAAGTAVRVLRVLLWAVPLGALLAGLLSTQRLLSRRLRRGYNPWLAAATVLLLVPLTGGAYSTWAEGRLGAVESDATALTGAWRDHSDGLTRDSTANLDRLRTAAPGAGNGCRPDQAAPTRTTAPGEEAIVRHANGMRSDSAVAADSNRLDSAMSGTALLIVAFILLGLRRPIEEYRYRSR